jgi:hypothetical protein
MIAITTVTGERYREYCDRLTSTLAALGIQHVVVHGSGEKNLKVNFWKYIPADAGEDEPIVFFDADVSVSVDFVMPEFDDNDILGVDIWKVTGSLNFHWAEYFLKSGARNDDEFNRLTGINSGAIYFKNKEVATRVGKRWAEFFASFSKNFPGAKDEPSLRLAMDGEKVGLIHKTYNDIRDPNAMVFHNTRKNTYRSRMFALKINGKYFVSMAKCGSTSLAKLAIEDKLSGGKSIIKHDEIRARHVRKNLTKPEGLEAYAFIRNPVERFESAMTWITERFGYSVDDVLDYLDWNIGNEPTKTPSKEMVKRLSRLERFELQSSLIRPSVKLYRFDDMAEKVLELTGRTIEHINKKEAGTKPTLTAEQRSKVLELYIDDVDLYDSIEPA